jgi:hypothetical protein
MEELCLPCPIIIPLHYLTAAKLAKFALIVRGELRGKKEMKRAAF